MWRRRRTKVLAVAVVSAALVLVLVLMLAVVVLLVGSVSCARLPRRRWPCLRRHQLCACAAISSSRADGATG